jgi:hypothetical protein
VIDHFFRTNFDGVKKITIGGFAGYRGVVMTA